VIVFGSLESLPLQTFIEQERADDHLWMFLHIPKTAGSSFGAELAKARAPYRNIHINYLDKDIPARKQMDSSIQSFIQELSGKAFRSCSGHFNISQANQIAESFPSTRLMTFLRNPVKRLISDYRYARTPAHPPHLEFIARFPTLEAYVDAPESQNKMFKLLIAKSNAGISEATEYLDQRYSFIGVVEMYPMSFNVISRLFGQNEMPSVHKRRTEATQDNIVEVTAPLQRRIQETNWKDAAIYSHVRDRLSAKREEWLAMRRGQSRAVSPA
jgi:hypothetical protein